jgi:release factor glutamine methyltransferase
MTVAEHLAEAARELRGAGVQSPEWDAERLLRHVLRADRAAIVASPGASVAADAERRFRELVRERASRVPLQHLVGTQAFWKHEFVVTPDVLIPRPETELLVEESLALLHGLQQPLIVDVGTGSGCIALALAAERENAELHATDVSEAALAVARDNARRLGLDGRVAWLRGDLLEPVAAAVRGRADLVVSNPPYVDPAERDSLAPEVRDHEPQLALFPPGDALSVYRRLVPAAAEVLKPGGALVVEIAPALEHAVAGLLEAAGLEGIEVRPDLAARPRVVLGRRPLGPRSRVG